MRQIPSISYCQVVVCNCLIVGEKWVIISVDGKPLITKTYEIFAETCLSCEVDLTLYYRPTSSFPCNPPAVCRTMSPWTENKIDSDVYRRIADVCFELHFRVTPGQFRPAAASSLHRRLALLATSTRPSFSKNAYLGILFAPMYQKYSLDFVSFGFYSNIQIV